MAIYDTDGHVIYSVPVSLFPGQQKAATIQIDCVDGYSLYGAAVADVAVEARHGTSGSWTNIETTPIDLTPWDGSRETFQVRFTNESSTAQDSRSMALTVRRPT